MTCVEVMLLSAEGGEMAARAIAPELLSEGDMVGVVWVEGGSSSFCAPFWPRLKVPAVDALRLIPGKRLIM